MGFPDFFMGEFSEDTDFDETALDAARRELNDGPEAPREFTFACRIQDIPSDGQRGKVVEMDRDEVAIFQIGGELFAISNICPHENSPILAAGIVHCEAMTVTCPLHGWTFDMASGTMLSGTEGVADSGAIGGLGGIPVYDVKVEQDEVWLRLRE